MNNKKSSPYLALSLIRSTIKPIEKAIALIENYEFSYGDAANTVGLHLSSVKRAMKAKKEGRRIGKTGRPNLLTEEQEQNLLNVIRDRAQSRNAMTVAEIQIEVFLILFLLMVIIVFRHH